MPRGVVTFLFTDVEGSTQLFQRIEDRYHEILESHFRILRAAVISHRGTVVSLQGDGFLAAFGAVADAIEATVAAQSDLLEHHWPQDAMLKVRMGLHTGQAIPVRGDYTALALHRAARVSAAAHGGQIICSQTTADLLASDLPPDDPVSLRDLGLHALKDFPEPEHLYQVAHPRLPVDFPAPKTISPRRDNLPVQRTAFIGRQPDLREVPRLFEHSPLVAITGPGGVGKTRLALEVAASLASSFVDGCWVVELAGLQSGSLVSTAVAEALEVAITPSRSPIDSVVDAVRHKSLLVVLDNCEHLLDACAEIADRLLNSCAGVRILATSRERIGISGEAVWRVAPMEVPSVSRPGAVSALDHDAVRLFADRAEHSSPGFTLTEANTAAVIEICRRLDGLPLAIELAAARVGVLAPRDIADHLDDRFQLLTQGNRAALPRHQTLRAALEWSVDLLPDAERGLFRCLGVFVGGWDLAAGEAIYTDPESEVRARSLLVGLVERSLVVAESGEADARRFSLLESVRELAFAQLVAAGEARTVQARHLALYLNLAERAKLEGDEQRTWFPVLQNEYDNLRAALAFACQVPERADDALRLASCLAPFWTMRGDLSEGAGWLERALDNAPRESSHRAAALLGAGSIAVHRGDYRAARIHLEQSAALFRAAGDHAGAARTGLDLAWVAWHEGQIDQAAELLHGYRAVFDTAGDTKGLADAHRMLGMLAGERHQLSEATEHLEQALALFDRIGDDVGTAASLSSLGILAEYRGELVAACQLMEESLAVARRCGDVRRIVGALDNLGFFQQQLGQLERALQLHQESLAMARDIGASSLVAAALTNLGSTARQLGDLAQAQTALRESLTIARDTSDRSRDVADVLEELAALYATEGEPQRGLMLFAAAEALRDAVGYPLREYFQNMYGPIVTKARATLPDASDVWSSGRQLPIEDAMALALAR
jgi:predicted ATPase/class 3 adenylate cyclase/Tfp pilus assembly protein PilF